MYWDQPLKTYHWPHKSNILAELLGDQHLLFWQPEFDFKVLTGHQSLQDLCDWANHGLSQGIDSFVKDPRNHYDIANLVKLNIWADDIRKQGMIKPWLILDWGDGKLEAGTGESRLRLCEIIPEIVSVSAFISTHRSRAHVYSHLEPVTTFDQLAGLCRAENNQTFVFRCADDQAPFGIYWYEYDCALTRRVTPDQHWCIDVFQKYYKLSGPTITTSWFADAVDWWQFCKTDS